MSSPSKIYLSAPDTGEDERQALSRVLDSNWIAPLGPEVDAFECELAKYCRRNHAAAVSSGTAAIHLALRLLGVSPGDTVVVPAFTFIATANPALYVGAKPIFVDSEAERWNLCPEQLRGVLKRCAGSGRLPRAVITVDLYGMPADHGRILPICEEFGVPVIEDSAEALGSFENGLPAGSFGNFGVLSFNGNKIITTSGGGALLMDDIGMAERARFLASQARDIAPHYQHSQLGYNYRLSNVLAAIGRAQLGRIDQKVTTRRSHFERYRASLEPLGVTFPGEPEGVRANRWLTTAIFPKSVFGADFSTRVRVLLEGQNIESRPLWKPLHLQPLFASCQYHGDGVAEKLFGEGLCLPSGSGLLPEQVDRVISHITEVIRKG